MQEPVKLTSDEKKKSKTKNNQVEDNKELRNNIEYEKNSSKTKKNLTGSYTEENPISLLATSTRGSSNDLLRF